MFELEKKSFGELDENERGMALTYLNGKTWEEIFEDHLEETSWPPSWLVERSKSWSSERLFSIDEMDPIWICCSLIHDATTSEYWMSDEGPNGFDYFEKMTPAITHLSPDDVCKVVFRFLRGSGGCVLYGNLTIDSAKWLPRAQVKAFMEQKMEENGIHIAGGDQRLSLDAWLDREYGTQK